MATYTMPLRGYIEQATQFQDGLSHRERIEAGRKNLFDFSYPLFDEAYKKTFETNFIRKFYTREIGFETEELFKFQLETWLLVNMPYFNKLYESELLKYNPLHNSEMNTTSNKAKDVDRIDTKDIIATGKNDVKTTNDSETNTTSTNTVDGTVTEDNFGRDLTSDTPDKRLAITTADGSGVIEYASEIKENSDLNKTTSASDEDSTGHSETHDTGSQSQNTSNVQNDKLNSDISEVEDFVAHRVGKIGVVSYPKLVTEYRNALLRIDNDIFKEMNQLFMLVY